MCKTFAINKVKQQLSIIENQQVIICNNCSYVIDDKIVTVKYSDLLELNDKYTVLRSNKLSYADLEIPVNYSLDSFVTVLEQDYNIVEIEYNGYGKYSEITPNDKSTSPQWYLSAIRANYAWDITFGSPNIKVAILDSGTDWSHPDLGIGSDNYQNIYCNLAEDDWADSNNPTTGNHIDDDGNGLIDDYKGWNFVTNTNDTRTTYAHGTKVAGIIGAKTNNSIGIAGIAGGNNDKGVSLVPYCVGIDTPLTHILDDAIIQAVDNGCRIIQLSLMIHEMAAINNALQYAKDNNVIVVCCSGNLGQNEVQYPASHPLVIAVGGIGHDYKKHASSNYGTNLNVVAPGVDIFTTTLSYTNSSMYYVDTGTSFAAPQVSAVIALVLSENPNLNYERVKNIIELTAQKVGGYNYVKTDSHPNGTWNDSVGYGLIDAYAAVLAAQPKYIQNQIYQSGEEMYEYATEITAGNAVTETKPHGDVVLEVGSDVTLRAMNQVILKPGFHAKAGSNLRIKVDKPTTSLSTTSSALQRIASRSSSAPTDNTEPTDEVATSNSLENIESEVILSTAIYTVSGQLIQTISGGQRDVAHLPSGMYILQYRMSDGSVRSEKIANNK